MQMVGKLLTWRRFVEGVGGGLGEAAAIRLIGSQPSSSVPDRLR